MKDRVPLYPGRVKLTPVSGQENTYDMVRADEPTQEGTPLSKATFLKDATAALFGLGTDAVPDDAFVAVGDKLSAIEKVGDVKTTIRTDLGDKWLLCNGDTFDPVAYPDLAKLLHPVEAQLDRAWIGPTGYFVCDVVDSGEYQVALYKSYVSSVYRFSIAYSTDWFRTYTTYNMYGGSSGNYFPSVSYGALLRYIDGMYIIAFSNDSGGYIYTSVTTDITNPVWSKWKMSQVGVNTFLLDLWKENGKFYVAARGGTSTSGSDYSMPLILSTPSITSPTWSSTAVNTTLCYPMSFTRANGYYAFFGVNTDCNVVYTTSLDKVWTKRDFTIPNCTNRKIPGKVTYLEKEGVWAFWGVGKSDMPVLAYTKNLSATSWSEVYNTSLAFGNSDQCPVTMAFAGDKYIALSRKYMNILLMPSLMDASTWTYTSLVSLGFPYNSYNNATQEITRQFRPLVTDELIVYPVNETTINEMPLMLMFPLHSLPKISETGAYAYIKALEG